MRRKDREVTDPAAIEDIIRRCACCRLGFNDDGAVYIVPLSFGYEQIDGVYTFYFHSAREGRKLDLLRRYPQVGFEMDTNYRLNEADVACGYSARFQSVIGNGTASLVESVEEKIKGLGLLMEHTAGKGDWQFDGKMLDAVAVFKVQVTSLSCKEHA